MKLVVQTLTGRSGALNVVLLCHNSRFDLSPEDALRLADELVDAAEAATNAIENKPKETLNEH